MRRLLLLAITVALAALVVHALTGFGSASVDALFTNHVYVGIEIAAVAMIGWRARTAREHRAAWWCVTAAFAFWTAGDALWAALPTDADRLQTDVLYLAFYPLCCAGMALIAAEGRERVAARMWFDGLLAALTVAALVVAIAFNPIVEATHGDSAQTAVNLAYPIGDLVLVGFVLTAFASQAWSPGRGWVLFGLGVTISAVADTLFVYQDAVGTYRDGSLLDVMWPTALVCCAWAVWQPWLPARSASDYGSQTFTFPSAFAVVALGLLAYDHFVPISHAGALLATAALVVAIVRAGITFHENTSLLRATRSPTGSRACRTAAA
jgi:hypothetical protein